VVDPATERQRLLASIAQLDDLYASGGLDEESYQHARTAQKRNLLLVTGARSEIGNHPGGTGPSGEARSEIGNHPGGTGASDEERSER
jgi:hypothetical protein